MCSANTPLGYGIRSAGMSMNPGVILSKAAEFKRGTATRPPDFYGGVTPPPTPQAFNPSQSGPQSLLIRTANVRSR